MEIYSTTLKKSQGRRTIEGGEDDESSGDQLCSLLGIKPLKRLRSGGEANPAAIHHLKYAPFVETRRETRELFSPSLSFSFSFSRLSLSLFFPFSFFPFLSPSLFRHYPCLILTFSRGDAFLFHLLLHLLLSPPRANVNPRAIERIQRRNYGRRVHFDHPLDLSNPATKGHHASLPLALFCLSFFLSVFYFSRGKCEYFSPFEMELVYRNDFFFPLFYFSFFLFSYSLFLSLSFSLSLWFSSGI